MCASALITQSCSSAKCADGEPKPSCLAWEVATSTRNSCDAIDLFVRTTLRCVCNLDYLRVIGGVVERIVFECVVSHMWQRIV